MKRMKMMYQNALNFEDGCNLFIENCKKRNLREGTINHYKQSYRQFFKYFDAEMPIEEMNKEKYDNYVIYLTEILNNDVSINAYLAELHSVLQIL